MRPPLKLLLTFALTCVFSGSLLVVGGYVAFRVLLNNFKNSPFSPFGGSSSPPLSFKESVSVDIGFGLILIAIFLFPVVAYLSRGIVRASTRSKGKRASAFTAFAGFPIIAVLVLVLGWAALNKISALERASFRERVTSSNTKISLIRPLTAADGQGHNFVELELELTDLPSNISDCRLLLELSNINGETPGQIKTFSIAQATGSKENDVWEFAQTIDGQQFDSGTPSSVLVRVKPISLARIPPEYLHGVKVYLSTETGVDQVIFASQYFPMEVPAN